MKRFLIGLAALSLVLAACRREAELPVAPLPAGEAPAADALPDTDTTTESPPVLADVVETDPRYIIGVSWPPEANKYPLFAVDLQAYVDAARAELMDAVAGMPADSAAGPYDLSLQFITVADSPRVFAIAAEGSSYTGGAHGAPLVARFVWLPEQQQRLYAKDLFADHTALREIAAYVREQLHAALSQRVDADEMEPGERERIIRSGARMIDAGTTPDIANFEQFEPVLDGAGNIRALRFVFPPYQVGPYSDGTQSVEVPATVFLPQVTAPYGSLFSGG